MTDPAAETTPEVRIQDPGVPDGPKIRLRLLLAFMRVAAGREGRAHLTWTGQAFRYVLIAERDVPKPPEPRIEHGSGEGVAEAIRRILDALARR